ncbi:heat shock protein 70 [Fomitiporia mediterranea MF3/22]|uniref:heat shock protein 70 n=1 Tax=Fomitiporia mediterranea (strain MF3/22) TaxID=694068 RepID=UPI0004407F94|nr:heat shock protein 70 [Fomitiporia mediterranea MF3/22]EJD02916.1 heat shock protein 70 [Fomitiporia mediterranea MF3/22]
MSVVGYDFGSLGSKIGVARRKGIDIITNEVSNRLTPSLVSFGPKQRWLGEPAKTAEVSNYKNTVGNLRRLIGRSVNDPEVQNVESKFVTAKLVDAQGTVGVQVNYLGEQHVFSSIQLVAMYLGKLRDTAARELNSAVSDVVISVPGWFTEAQRRATIDAAQVAGLNVLRLINDTTAAAFEYGIKKTDLPEADNPRHVVFVDVGHSDLSVAVVALSKGQLTVKATAYDRNLGGRDIDYALVRHFAKEFKEKYKIDVLSNPKAVFRLSASCEKLKKILSANTEAPLSVENIMNDIDASSKLTRDAYETLVADVLDRITAPIKAALADSGLSVDQIDAIELVGGSSRIPAVRQRIQSVFPGKQLSTTLNQDEAIARGATFACASLSPVFRVKEFSMVDVSSYAIKVQWERVPDEEDSELLVFPRGNSIPSTKILTFYRKEPFTIEASYAEPEALPGNVNPWISRLTVKQVAPPDAKGDISPIKVKVKLNQHGLVSFEQVYYEEIEEREEKMDVDGAEAPKKKRIVRKKDLAFVVGTSSLDASTINSLRELENQMHASDKFVADTLDRKNALEEYIYDMRSKLEDRYAAYAQPQEKESLLTLLSESEDWLYSDEGEDASKSAYVERLDAAKKIGDKITARYLETENRAAATAQLREALNTYYAQATSEEERFAHIDPSEKQTIVEKVATIQKWLDDQLARQAEKPKNADPVVTCGDILKKKDELIYFASPILNKPKPKPKVESTPGSGAQTPKTDPNAGEQKDKKEEKANDKGPTEMDVD